MKTQNSSNQKMSKASVSFFSSKGEEILVKSKDVKKAECQFIPTVKKILVKSKDVLKAECHSQFMRIVKKNSRQ